MNLPPSLSAAVLGPPDGRLALVIGAGCSIDEPTCLKLAGDYAEDAYRMLIEAEVPGAAECNRRDLSALAELAFNEIGSQEMVTRVLPIGEFRSATPNEGHKIAIALMVERIIGMIVTVNLDLALDNAISFLGARSGITSIHKEEEHQHLGRYAIVYLHRTINEPAEDWILRKAQIETAWQDGWQALMAASVATIPNLIFAGLGSPLPVITTSVGKVKSILGDATTLYQVDTLTWQDNSFASDLGVSVENYVVATWNDFMRAIGVIVAQTYLDRLRVRCGTYTAQNALPQENSSEIVDSIMPDLLQQGKLRAEWFLESIEYKPYTNSDIDLMADIVVAVALAKRITAADQHLQVENGFELRQNGRIICRTVPMSGGGSKYWGHVEAKLSAAARKLRQKDHITPLVFILTGVTGVEETSVPTSIVAEANSSIVSAIPEYSYFTATTLRADSKRLLEALA